MKVLLREYVTAVLSVGAVFGGAVLVLEVPPVDAGARWVMCALFVLAGEYRWAALAAVMLALAGFLTVASEKRGPAGDAHEHR